MGEGTLAGVEENWRSGQPLLGALPTPTFTPQSPGQKLIGGWLAWPLLTMPLGVWGGKKPSARTSPRPENPWAQGDLFGLFRETYGSLLQYMYPERWPIGLPPSGHRRRSGRGGVKRRPGIDIYSIQPGFPHPTATATLRTRIHTRPIRRQTPTGGPLAESLDLVARSDSHGHDVLGGLNQGNV